MGGVGISRQDSLIVAVDRLRIACKQVLTVRGSLVSRRMTFTSLEDATPFHCHLAASEARPNAEITSAMTSAFQIMDRLRARRRDRSALVSRLRQKRNSSPSVHVYEAT